MQTVLEQGSIDKPLTFDVGLIQLSFIPVCSLKTFQSNCAEGLHFSAFHYISEESGSDSDCTSLTEPSPAKKTKLTGAFM